MSPPPSELPRLSGSRPLKPSTTSTSSFWSERVTYFGGAVIASLLVWCLWWSVINPNSPSQSPNFKSLITPHHQTSSAPDFHLPDPRVGKPITDWDFTRRQYQQTLHPNSIRRQRQNRILMITGSQPSPCKSPVGDHLLLRFFKNKVDYCRIHGCEIFYNNVLLQPEMSSYWAKYPVIRAAMITHPEVEWIWWVDSDAAITDMSFKLKLNRYANYNLVVQGWNNLIYGQGKKSWYGANAGVFLIRNCQWSMDLMESWSNMGPINPEFSKWGSIQKSVFPDKLFPEADDQTGLLYLLVKEKDKWADKVFIEEKDVYFQKYWVPVMDDLKNRTLTDKWSKEMGKRRPEGFDADMETEGRSEEERETKNEEMRRPFITHFTGCQPCSGKHNKIYPGDSCSEGMEMALNFADNQVLLNYGYVHPDLHFSSLVDPLPGL